MVVKCMASAYYSSFQRLLASCYVQKFFHFLAQLKAFSYAIPIVMLYMYELYMLYTYAFYMLYLLW